MPSQKKQHFVPKFYLKNFTDKDNLLSIYNHSSEKIISKINYTNQCQEDYFYGKDGTWETKLANLETIWGSVFKKIINKDILSDSETESLKLFALYQRFRTKAENEFVNNRRKQANDIINIMANNANLNKFGIEKISPIDSLEIAEENKKNIKDLQILIIDYQTTSELILSDYPIIMINPFCPNVIGLLTIGLIIFFPLTPNMLVVLYDGKIYDKYNNVLYISSVDENEVKHLNNAQFIMSLNTIYASNEKYLQCFNGHLKHQRSKNQKCNQVVALGSEREKIIQHCPYRLFYKHNFSFSSLSYQAQKVPISFRDYPPRQYDKRWVNRIFVDLYKIMQISYMNGKLTSVKSRKDIIKGCDKMANFMKKYWNLY